MKTRYELKPTGRYSQTLVFDWDLATGTVSGPSARWIRDVAADGSIATHPLPWQWTFSKTPLKSKTDMADFYPKWQGSGAPDTSYTDTDGVVVIRNDALTF